MTAFPKYPHYKDSGVEWLGEVPEHWEVEKGIRYFYETESRSTTGDEELLSVSHLTGVTPRSEKNITMFMAESYEGSKLCEVGDIAINTMWAWMAALGVSRYRGLVSPSYGTYRQKKPERFNPTFLDHLIRMDVYRSHYTVNSTGITTSRLRLYPHSFLRLKFVCPPRAEQDRIVAFLDEKTAQIDALIAKKQRQIELLDEQKAILINRAVTRGLHPDPDLQDSGIEWLPSMPRHWQRMKLRHLASMIQTGPFGSQLHSEEYVEGGVPVVNPSHMKDGAIVPDMRCAVSDRKATILGRHKLQPGDIVFARRGELGRCALVTEIERDWLCGTGSLLFRPKRGIFDPAYLVQVLSDHRIAALLTLQSVGSTMDNLNTAMIANISIPLPPISEQAAIMKAVAELKAAFQLLGQKVESQIQTLQTLRSTLIAHAVTGKIAIPAATA